MFKAFGVATADKRQLFQSHLEVMRAAWRGEPVTTDDSHEPVYLSPLPVQRPHPPLWVAAFGPLALRQVGTLGLPYLASPLESLAVLESNYRVYHEAVQAAGKALVKTVPVMRTVFVTASRSEAVQVRAALARAVPVSARHQPGLLDDWAIVGDCHYTADRLAEYAGRLGLTHLIVRGGIAGVTQSAQMRSHEQLLGLTT
jgi:alkanesulfonate monooxygenase SsuD/methylene tetrahydromethanopterin reductase-like flavin-dependent oxidoreductase (luciferase family)